MPLPINALINKAAGVLGIRMDPHRAYNFWLEIGGMMAGGFTEVSGLKAEVDVQTYREGGLNTYAHQLAGGVKEGTLTLKRGLTDADTLWPWCDAVMSGTITRRNMTIYVLDQMGLPAMWWDLRDAFPVSWEGPALTSDGNAVAFESLSLVFHGLHKPTLSQVTSAARAAAGAAMNLI